MKNKKLIDAWNKIEPSEADQERMRNNILMKHKDKRNSSQWRPMAAVAAAAVVLLSGYFIYNNTDTHKTIPTPQQMDGNNISNAQNNSNIFTDEIRGLPVKNFSLTELEQQIAADRIAFYKFINFFQYNTDSFVIVKVTDTKAVPADDSSSETQVSTVESLDTVWGNKAPDTINITQYVYGGCTGDEATNLLRKGGVYLLPLTKYNGNYYLVGDLDVLFEIDDEGLIWSHSGSGDFNQFDGSDYKTVTDKITSLTQDETIMLAASSFGMTLRGFQLAEVTILSEGIEEKNEYGYSEIAYKAQVNKSLSGDDLTSEISIHSYADENLPLNKDGRYLLFIDNYENKHYINPRMVASVGSDETIKNLGDETGPFAGYDGYSVEELQVLADKVADYLSAYPE